MSQIDAFQGSVSTLLWLSIISVGFTENAINKAYHHYSGFYLGYLLSLPPRDEISVSRNITHGQALAKCMLLDLYKCSGQTQQCKVLLIFLVNTSSDIPENNIQLCSCPEMP